MDAGVRSMVEAGEVRQAASQVVRVLGPEVFGFLCSTLGNDADADEIFAATSVRIWTSIASFRWQCTLRTWVYVIARNELARYTHRARRRNAGRVTPSELDNLVAAVRTETRSTLRSANIDKLKSLRDELPVDDRMLLILRVDRALRWDEIARAFLPHAEDGTEAEIKREAARLRKRFQLVKQRLTERARQEGVLT